MDLASCVRICLLTKEAYVFEREKEEQGNWTGEYEVEMINGTRDCKSDKFRKWLS